MGMPKAAMHGEFYFSRPYRFCHSGKQSCQFRVFRWPHVFICD